MIRQKVKAKVKERLSLHPEGYRIIIIAALIIGGAMTLSWCYIPGVYGKIVAVILFLFWAFIFRFFRSPEREMEHDSDVIYSPADGVVVVVEETFESEYFKEQMMQVSVFMTIWNVHVNWFPIGGKVEYVKYHPGRFLVAWHPKSSEENERTTIVIQHKNIKILMRQIAGLVARRIVTYAKEGQEFAQSSQCGFIKFGSRVDLFLPLGTEIGVKVGDKVTGTQTVIARLNNGIE